MATLLIGIDDTDNPTSRGTGHLARQVLRQCVEQGMQAIAVTRHQFLLDPAIPYTSHNSGACVAVETTQSIDIARFVVDDIVKRSADGSDPGLCMTYQEAVPAAVQDFGMRASQEVLTMTEPFRVAKAADIRLLGLGGTCGGVIGALSSVGQYTYGQTGRYIDLPGLRALSGTVKREQIETLGIRLEHNDKGCPENNSNAYNTLDWIRPALIHHEPVLKVEWSAEYNAWIPSDRKKSRPLE